MKLFKTVKEIKSREGVLHFKRFAILECRYFNVYIHTIYRADEDEHMHNHPWDYTSIVLSGRFVEQTWSGLKTVRQFDVVRRKAVTCHKIYLLFTPRVRTLFFTGPRKREWEYYVNGLFVDHVTYRKEKNARLNRQESYVS